MRVLLVDPDPDAGQALVAHLRVEGCCVDQTDTGWHAWEMLGCCRYNAVIMELRLRDISGLELLRMMRAMDAAPPSIVGMRNLMPSIERIATSMGAAKCYVKPMPPACVYQLLLSAVEHGEDADELGNRQAA